MFKKKTGYKMPEFRKSTPPPPPITGSNAVKPNPSHIPPASVKTTCVYETPCGWCAKWEKKCDKKIGGGNDVEPRKMKDEIFESIKSGKLPPLKEYWEEK